MMPDLDQLEAELLERALGTFSTGPITRAEAWSLFGSLLNANLRVSFRAFEALLEAHDVDAADQDALRAAHQKSLRSWYHGEIARFKAALAQFDHETRY